MEPGLAADWPGRLNSPTILGHTHQEFFLWYALAEAVKDWQKTRDSLEELLRGSKPVNA